MTELAKVLVEQKLRKNHWKSQGLFGHKALGELLITARRREVSGQWA